MQNNLESINLIVSMIGQIGVFITIILVFLTLKEMEKQRRESYKPIVVIPSFWLEVIGRIEEKTVVFYDPQRGGFFEEESVARKKLAPRHHVELYNVGAGVAKDIEIEWKLEFETSDAVDSIREFCYKNSIPLIVEIDKGNLIIRHKSEAYGSFTFFCDLAPIKGKIDYILPQSVEPSRIRLALPMVYQKLISLLATTCDSQTPQFSSDLPIILDIRYRDIGNKQYRNQYLLKIADQIS
ncbi:MAG: hypothetical protein EHM20_11555, partial [Alphaproteobacteria bacterium]